MIKIFKSLVLLLFGMALFSPHSKAQIPCNYFCVTNIEINPNVPNVLSVTIYMGGTNNDFISYPHVALVTNLNGDTIATGGLDFFGQFGGTSQIYSPTTTLTSLPLNFTGTVYFVYDNDTCMLQYPCPWVGLNENFKSPLVFKIHPNPAKEKIVIYFDDAPESDWTLTINNAMGQKMVSKTIHIKNGSCEIGLRELNLESGIYHFIFHNSSATFYEKLILVK